MRSSSECKWHLDGSPEHRSGKEKEPAEDTKTGQKNRKVQCPGNQVKEARGQRSGHCGKFRDGAESEG